MAGHLRVHRLSSTCRGATLWGREQWINEVQVSRTKEPRTSQYSIGFAMSKTVFDRSRQSKYIYQDQIEGVEKAKNQMEWLLKKVTKSGLLVGVVARIV